MFSDEEKNEIYRKYKLSEEEHMELYGKIKKIWTMDKTPVDNPVAVIVGGQTGKRKTGLTHKTGASVKMLPSLFMPEPINITLFFLFKRPPKTDT